MQQNSILPLVLGMVDRDAACKEIRDAIISSVKQIEAEQERREDEARSAVVQHQISREVAKHVFGYTEASDGSLFLHNQMVSTPHFASSHRRAFEVVDKMLNMGYQLAGLSCQSRVCGGLWRCEFENYTQLPTGTKEDNEWIGYALAETVPMVVCLSALSAVGHPYDIPLKK